jgi:PAS domain S-box-containing protein
MKEVSELDDCELAELGRCLIIGMADAVVYADRNGTIRFWNSGAEKLFGFTKDEALGQSLDIIVPERLRQRHWAGYRQMMAAGTSRHAADELLSVPAQSKSGSALSVQFTVTPVRGGDGRLAGIAAVLRDVTATFLELKQLRATVTRR